MGDAMDEENGDHQLRSSDNTTVVSVYDQIESGEWISCPNINVRSPHTNSKIRGVV